jgi:anti-sigma factor ChrR (cupin superfamily)
MKRTTGLLALSLAALCSPAWSADDHVFMNPSDIKFGPAPPNLPKGALIAVLYGDPGKPGPVVMRLKAPAGAKIAPHWHSTTENLTVISGELFLGDGDTMDMKKGTGSRRAATTTCRPNPTTTLSPRRRPWCRSIPKGRSTSTTSTRPTIRRRPPRPPRSLMPRRRPSPRSPPRRPRSKLVRVETRKAAEELDREDELARFRAEFELPPGVIYLDGNSLGALPRRVRERVRRTLEREWGEGLIASWNSAGWISGPQHAGDKVAKLIGAGAGEVVVTESTSVNLFEVLSVQLSQPGAPRDRLRKGQLPDRSLCNRRREAAGGRHELLLVDSSEALDKALAARRSGRRRPQHIHLPRRASGTWRWHTATAPQAP